MPDWDDDRPRRRRRDEDDDFDDDRPRRRGDDFDDPPRRRRGEKASNGPAVASLILGILSLMCAFFTGVPAVICGIFGLSKASRTGTGKGMAFAGMGLGAAGSVVLPLIGYFLLAPYAQENRAHRKSQNSLKRLGVGMHNQHDAMSHFVGPDAGMTPPQPPPAFGQKVDYSTRLSWRVGLLPYIEQDSLYKRFIPTEPWDGPTNRPLAGTVVADYADADTPSDPTTRYRVFVGRGAMFDGLPNQRTRMTDITDGTSNTIMVAEAADKVTWTQTNELAYDDKAPVPPLGRPKAPTFQVLMADGSVRVVRKTIDDRTLRAIITRNGGEVFTLPP